jgi:hypothetical protein
MTPVSPILIEALRSALAGLESTPGLDPKDPKILQFKASILLAIAELEARKSASA